MAHAARRLALTAALALSLLLSAACSSMPKSADGDPGVDYPIIDAHMHTVFASHKPAREDMVLPDKSRAEFFKELKEAGVGGGIAHALPGGAYLENMRKQGIVHCAGVGDRIDEAAIEAGLKDGTYGCIKVYLGYYFKYPSDAFYEPLYRLAERFDVPVVFHTGDTFSPDGKVKYSHPLAIDEVAVTHRKVRFVIAHCGNPWIQDAAEVAYKNENVFVDISAFLADDPANHPKEYVDEYVIRPIRWVLQYMEKPEKMMFGTDWPLTNIKSYRDVVKRAIPPQHWKAVFHDNAVRVFKLEQVNRLH